MMVLVKKILAISFKWITIARNYLYDVGILSIYRSKLPVICIGNITAGGNGKTPLCHFLVMKLRLLGYSPVVLSRGYGGLLHGPLYLKESHTPEEVGDEPCLLSHILDVPVVIARSRVEGAKLIETSTSHDVIILDDGYQHRALHRDFNVVVQKAGSKDDLAQLIEGDVLPKGMLREELGRALKRADVIVCSSQRLEFPQWGQSVKIEAAIPFFKGPIFFSRLKAELPIELLTGRTKKFPNGQQCVVMSALGNPEAFEETLATLGYECIYAFQFPDHYSFSTNDIRKALDVAQGNPVFCTSKDAIKLLNYTPEGIYELRVTNCIDDEETFLSLVVNAIEQHYARNKNNENSSN